MYVCEAKEAFEIGLLTKRHDEPVTGKQELHSFLKAAFGLTMAHGRLHGDTEAVRTARQLCRVAVGKLFAVSIPAGRQDKDTLSREIMSLVAQVKGHLQVQSFSNFDGRSYIPASFGCGLEKPILHEPVDFQKVLETYSQHHTSVCEVFESTCENNMSKQKAINTAVCITALRTETKSVDTVGTEDNACFQRGPRIAENGQETLKGAGRGTGIPSDASGMSLDSGVETETAESPAHGSVTRAALDTCPTGSQTCSSPSGFSALGSPVSREEGRDHAADRSPGNGPGEEPRMAPRCPAALSEEPETRGHSRAARALSSERQGVSFQVSADGSFESPESHRHKPLPPTVPAERALEDTPQLTSVGPTNPSTCSRPSLSPASQASSASGQPKNMSTCAFIQEEETSETTDEFPEISCDAKDRRGQKGAELKRGSGPPSEDSASGVDPEGDTVDPPRTMDGPLGESPMTACGSLTPPRPVQIPDPGQSGGSVPEQDPEPDAPTEDRAGQLPQGTAAQHPGLRGSHRRGQDAETPLCSGSGACPWPALDEDCTTTEEGSGDAGLPWSSAHCWQSPAFPSGSEGGDPLSGVDPRGSSSGALSGPTRQDGHEPRTLQPDDLEKLLAGVSHGWLLRRLENTGVFKSSPLHRAYGEYRPSPEAQAT